MNDLLLLAMLSGAPTHGYELKKRAGLLTGQANLHNNLVYPLLGRFRKAGWIQQKTSKGQRGQTREVYSLTPKGRKALRERLSEFSAKDAASEGAFRLRVGMFFSLEAPARARILQVRDEFLAQREEKFANLVSAMQLGKWGGEVTSFLLQQIRAERKWISKLKEKR